jgi:hypothetical protein
MAVRAGTAPELGSVHTKPSVIPTDAAGERQVGYKVTEPQRQQPAGVLLSR